MEPGPLGSRDRPHVCSYCDRGFRKLEHLRRHTRIHTKEKPYVCHCGSSFSRRDLLRRHDRLSHPSITTGESEVAPEVETYSAPEFQTHPARLQGNTAGGNIVVAESSPTSLPLPPEYYDQRSTFLVGHDEEHPLSAFRSFLRQSTLGTLAERFSPDGEARQYQDETIHQGGSIRPVQGSRFVSESSNSRMISATVVEPTDEWLCSFMGDHSDFSLPSQQTLKRYFHSYAQHNRLQLTHPESQPRDFGIVLRLAMLSLGAQNLYEAKNAKLLFQASKSMAIRRWNSCLSSTQQQDSQPPPVELVHTFLLLIEYIKLEQAANLPRELCVLQSGLLFFLGNDTDPGPPTDFAAWVKGEVSQWAQTLGFCIATTHDFIFDSFPASPKPRSHLRLPCSSELWQSIATDNFVAGDNSRLYQGPQVDQIFQALLCQRDYDLHTQFGQDTAYAIYIITSTLIQRMSAIETMALSTLAYSRAIYYKQLENVAAKCDLALNATQSSGTAVTHESIGNKARSLLRLVCIRMAISGSCLSSEALYANDAPSLAAALNESLTLTPPTDEILTLAVGHCIDILEEPATTGVTFFIRSRSSSWGLETLMAVFESALLLSMWARRFLTGIVPSKDTGLLERLKYLLPLAWSSTDLADDLPPDLGFGAVSGANLGFWAYLLSSQETKPFAQLLGRTLHEYSRCLNSD